MSQQGTGDATDGALARLEEQVTALRAKYARPVFGLVNTWDLLEQLGGCVDPADPVLYGASQQLHALQVLTAMEADGVKDPVLLAAALIHDVGKLLLLAGEAPENVVGPTAPIVGVGRMARPSVSL